MKGSIFDTIDPQTLERINQLRLMDDDFMTVVFDGDNGAAEFLLRIILNSKKLKVKQCMTQKEKRNLFGRSVKLDIVAEDFDKKLYNIEIQRADKGASPRRVRYNISMMDSHYLRKNEDVSSLPEVYIIFITENDYLGYGKAIYKIKKLFDVIDNSGNSLPFEDGCNIMYVNGAYRGNDEIGKLMHDFCTSNPDEMFYTQIAERVRFHKQEEKGVKNMCRIFEEYGEEKKTEGKKEEQNNIAMNMIKDGSLSYEKISAFTGIPLDHIKQLAEKVPVEA